jgi:hypothetical protein
MRISQSSRILSGSLLCRSSENRREAGSPLAWFSSRWILAAVGGFFADRLISYFAWNRTKRSALGEFWDPIFASSEPVLFCVADQTQYTAIALRDAEDPSRQVIAE